MKIFKRFCIILTLLVIMSIISPIYAIAADSDFQISYTLFPDKIAELGGTIKITLQVENKGPTNITWIRTDVLTNAYFSSDWSGSLGVGAIKNLIFQVPFASTDLDHNITMNVYIENDLDASRDGKQTKNIKVESEDNVFLTSGVVDPEKEIYYVGDTVEVKDKFRNGLAIQATNVTVEYYHRVDGNGVYNGSPIGLGTVAGGDSVYNTFDYTFKEADIGEFRIGSQIKYNVSGKGPYDEYNYAHDFIVQAVPEPEETPAPTQSDEIMFTANLTAGVSEVNAGDGVIFNVAITNTGTAVIDMFEIYEGEMLLNTTGSTQAGESIIVPITKDIIESSDVFFTINAKSGEDNKSEYTNIVHIKVNETEAVESAADLSVNPQETNLTAEQNDADSASNGIISELFGNSTLGIIIIIALVVIFILLIILIAALVVKRKK